MMAAVWTRAGNWRSGAIGALRAGVCLLGCMLALAAGPAGAQTVETLVSNVNPLDGAARSSLFVGDYSIKGRQSVRTVAQKFRTGSNPTGYTLRSVDFEVEDVDSRTNARISIYTVGSDGNPGSSLYVLTGTLPRRDGDSREFTFTAPMNATLMPDTSYFVYFEDTVRFEGRNGYNINTLNDTDESVARQGWSISDRYHRNEGNGWGEQLVGPANSVRMRLKGIENADSSDMTAPVLDQTGTPPYLYTSGSNTFVVLTYDEDLDSGSMPSGSFFILGYDGGVAQGSLATIQANTVTLRFFVLVHTDQRVRVSYRPTFLPSLQDSDGNRAAGFDNVTVANRSTVVNQPPTGAPTISGTARIGATLTASTAGIEDPNGLTDAEYRYQWIRVDAGTDTDIGGATASSYTLDDLDAGKQVKVRVSFLDDRGFFEQITSAVFPSSGTIASSSDATGAPTISGTAAVGEVLSASTAGIADPDGLPALEGYRYQWFRVDGGNDILIAGATAANYRAIAADAGKQVKVRVNFTDGSGTTEFLRSAAYPDTGAIAAGTNTVATGAPEISGAAAIHEVLFASPGSIADANGLTQAGAGGSGFAYRYQWIRVDGGADTDIEGATSSDYRVVAADVGKQLKVRASFLDDHGYAEVRTSAAFPQTGSVSRTERPLQLPTNHHRHCERDSGMGMLSGPGHWINSPMVSQRFTTGSNTTAYRLEGILIRVDTYRDPDGFRVHLHRDRDGLPDRHRLFELHSVGPKPARAGTMEFRPRQLMGEYPLLEPDTHYHIVFQVVRNAVQLEVAETNDVAMNGGFGLDDHSLSYILPSAFNESIDVESHPQWDTTVVNEDGHIIEENSGFSSLSFTGAGDFTDILLNNEYGDPCYEIQGTTLSTDPDNPNVIVRTGGFEVDNGWNRMSKQLKVRILGTAHSGSAPAFNLPPRPVSATVPAAGTTLDLLFDNIPADGEGETPPVSAFTVEAAGVAVTVSAVEVSAADKRVRLTLGSTVRRGDRVRVSYEDPSDGDDAAALQSPAGNDAPGFTDYRVDNDSTVSRNTPVPLSASVRSQGDRVDIIFDRELDDRVPQRPGASQFTVTQSGQTVAVTGVEVSRSSRRVRLRVPAIYEDRVVTVSYEDPTTDNNQLGALQAPSGHDVESFTDFAATNNSNQSDPSPNPVSATVSVTGLTLDILFTLALDGRAGMTPAVSQFTVTQNGAAVAIDSLAVSGPLKRVRLTLDQAIRGGRTVTVSYRDRTAGDDMSSTLQAPTGEDTPSFTGFAVTNSSALGDPAPRPVSATIVAPGGYIVDILFDKLLDDRAGHVPPASAFTVTIQRGVVERNAPVTEVVVDGAQKRVRLVTSGQFGNGETVRVSYADPTTGDDTAALQAPSGEDAPSFTDHRAALEGGAGAPNLVWARLSSSRSGIFLLFDRHLIRFTSSDQRDTLGDALAVTVDGTAAAFEEAASMNATEAAALGIPRDAGITVQFSNALAEDVTDLSLTYTDPSAGDDAVAIQSLTGTDAASFTVSVELPEVESVPLAPVSAVGVPDGTSITITFNQVLHDQAGHVPPASAFTVNIGGTSAAPTAVAVNGAQKEVRLTTSSSLTSGQTVTVSYTDPTDGDDTAALQTPNGDDAPSFTDYAVTLASGPPRLQWARLSSSRTFIFLLFDRDLTRFVGGDQRTALTNAIAVTAGGTAADIEEADSMSTTDATELGVSREAGITVQFSNALAEDATDVSLTYTDPTAGNDAVAIQSTAGEDAASFTTTVDTTTLASNTEAEPLSAELRDLPRGHGGEPFVARLVFSEGLPLKAATLEAALTVTGGTLTSVTPVTAGETREWDLALTPASAAEAVRIALAATTDCTAAGAICTEDRRPLSQAVSAEVAGRVPTHVVSAQVTSYPGTNGIWNGNETVVVEVRFSRTVGVYGPPNVKPTVGILLDETRRDAVYTVGGGTDTLRFEYRVTAEDDGARSVRVVANSLDPKQAVLGDNEGHAAQTGFEVADLPAPARPTVVLRMAENAAPGTAVGAPVSAGDPDFSTLTYALYNEDGTPAQDFTIDASTGQIRTREGVFYDYEIKPVYRLVAVADDGRQLASVGVRIELTDLDEVLTARFEEAPETHGGEPFGMRLVFSEPVTVNWKTLRDKILQVSGGRVTSVRRLDRDRDLQSQTGDTMSALRKIRIEPSTDAVTVTLPATRHCGAELAVCTIDGRALSQAVSVTVEPGTLRELRATQAEYPGVHDRAELDLEVAFTAPVAVTPAAMREHALAVTNAEVVSASMVSGDAARWRLRILPLSNDTVTVTLPAPSDCALEGAVCTADGRALTTALTWRIAPRDPGAADTTGPALVSAELERATLVLLYDEGLDEASVPAPGAFAVTVAGEARSLAASDAVQVRGRRVLLALESPAAPGEAAAVSYTVPGENPLRDRAGNDAGALAGHTLTNTTPEFTVRFASVPDSHDGSAPLVFEILFSDRPAAGADGRNLRTILRTGALFIRLGHIRIHPSELLRLDKPGRKHWRITVPHMPSYAHVADGDFTIELDRTRDCADLNALCTEHGWKLSNRISARVKFARALTVADAQAAEAPGATVDFAVRLSLAASEPVMVDYSTADGSAMAGEDYVSTSGTLNFAPGETLKTVSVPVVDNGIRDDGDRFSLTLYNVSGGATQPPKRSATGTILDGGPPTQVVGARLTSGPGENGTWDSGETVVAEVAFNREVRVQGPSGATPTLGITLDGERREAALAGPGPARTLVFRHTVGEADDGAAAAAIVADGITLNEAVIADRQGHAALLAFSPGSALSVADATATEGTDTTADFVVTLAPAATETVTVNYATSDGTATAPADYTSTSGTLTFAAGETSKTVSVPVIDDDVEDGGETFTLVLASPSGGEAYLADAAATATIHNDETAATGLTAEFLEVPEGHGGNSFTVDLRFSENVTGLSYATLRDHAFTVTGGRVTGARRLDRDGAERDREWEIRIAPDGNAGDVTVTLPATTDCAATGAVCVGDRPLSASASVTVPREAAVQQDPATPFRVRLDRVPEEHDGSSPIVLRVLFNKQPGADYSYVTMRDATVRARRDGSAVAVSAARRLSQGRNDRWEITVPPGGKGDVTVSVGPFSSCAETGAVCTGDGAVLSNAATQTILGPPGLAVADARVHEAAGAVLDFAVTLGRASASAVTVDYATSDGTATAGSDYTVTSGTLTFAPGETAKTVSVPVLGDDHDEGGETLTLTLSNPSGGNAWLKDATATGTIENSDAMPRAWLARFGRTAAEQVMEAVEGRFAASRTPGVAMTLAGQALPSLDSPGFSGSRSPGSGSGAGGAGVDTHGTALADADARAGLEAMSQWLAGTENGADRRGSRAVTPRDLLTGTSFALTGGTAEHGLVSFWGRGAVSRFDGREPGAGGAGDLTLSGEVASAMLGADWARERWTAGLLLSRSEGEGSYRGQGEGQVSSTLTGLFPYGRHALNDRVTLWGVAGYGEGELTLTPEPAPDADPGDQSPMRTDMDLSMGAVGLHGVAVEAGPEGGFELAVTSDAMAVRTSSEKTGGLEAAEADATRLRLGLEGTWRGIEAGGGGLAPRFEIGLRHDGGDAETGFGLDLGGGLSWSHPASGLSAEFSGRGLLTHESDGFRDRGLSGSFAWDPGQGSGRGPSLTLTQTVGASASGGMDALLRRETLAGLAANDNGAGNDDLANRRLELRMGYGFPAFGDWFTSAPELSLGLSSGQREYGLGWRLNLVRGGGTNALELTLEATRRESASDNTGPEDGVGLRATARW